MTEDNAPSGDKDAYCITRAIYRPAAQIISSDTGVTIPATGEDYEYVFSIPGVYNVVFVASVPTLAGNEEIIKRFEITVTE